MITVEKLVFPPIPTDSHRLFHGDIPYLQTKPCVFFYHWFPRKSPLNPKSRKKKLMNIPIKNPYEIPVLPIPALSCWAHPPAPPGPLARCHRLRGDENVQLSRPTAHRLAWHQWRSCKIYRFLTMINYGQYQLIAHPPAKYQPLTMVIYI